MGECMVGIFVTEEKSPVDNAQVKLYQKNSMGDLVVFDSTTTNSAGHFTFVKPQPGLYCLESYVKEGDDIDTLLTFFTEGVEYVSGIKDVGILIMKAPGKIKGRVRFDSTNVSGVKCYIPGTSFIAHTDDSGLFVMSNIAENRYDIVVDGALYHAVTKKSINVVSNETTDIGDVALLLDTTLVPIPPEGITGSYDSITGHCRVEWHALKLLDLAGYQLYRQLAGEEYPHIVQEEKITDTFYLDTLWKDVYDKGDKSASYQLKSVDNENNISTTFSPKFSVTPKSGPQIEIEDSVRVTITGTLSGSTEIVSRVSATLRSGGSKNPVDCEWHPVSKAFVGSVMRADNGTRWTAVIRVYDTSNHLVAYGSKDFDKLSDTISVSAFDCENAKPAVIAMNDTTLSISDSLLLRAVVVDTLSIEGSVADEQEFTCEWSVGGGDFTPVSTVDTIIVLPAVVTDSFNCLIRATDSDGNVSAVDTVVVTVKNDKPVIEIRSYPTEATFDGEMVTIRTKASDTLGWIVSTQYKTEFQDAFTAYSGDTLSIVTPETPDADFTVTFKATDEDGNTSIDSCQFPINVWSKVLGGYENDFSKTALELEDGSLIIVGNSNSFSIDQDILLYHIDSKGEVLWKKTYGISEDDTISGMVSSSEGIFIGGSTKPIGYGGIDSYIMKVSYSGDVYWKKTYGLSENDIAFHFDSYDENSFLLVGQTNSFDGEIDGLVIKVDQNGDMLWLRNYGGEYSERFRGFDITTNGDIILVGFKKVTENDRNLWILKLNKSGELLWEKTFGGSRIEEGNYVSILPNGNILVSGSTNSTISGDYECWLLETDSIGTLIWEKKYGSQHNDFCQIVKPLDDGTYLLTGAQNHPHDSWLCKVDAKGSIIWEKTFGGKEDDFSWDALLLKDGGIVSISSSMSFSNNEDFWITKFDAQGNSVNLP